MKIKMNSRNIVQAAVIAAIYVAITLLFAPISYGAVQVRISEALTVLAGITPIAIPGLFIGCLAANIIGGFGLIDTIFGSLATLIAAILSWKLRKNIWLVPLPPVIVNAVIVGAYLTLFLPIPLWLSMIYVGVGQIGACYVLGIPTLLGVRKLRLFEDKNI